MEPKFPSFWSTRGHSRFLLPKHLPRTSGCFPTRGQLLVLRPSALGFLLLAAVGPVLLSPSTVLPPLAPDHSSSQDVQMRWTARSLPYCHSNSWMATGLGGPNHTLTDPNHPMDTVLPFAGKLQALDGWTRLLQGPGRGGTDAADGYIGSLPLLVASGKVRGCFGIDASWPWALSLSR